MELSFNHYRILLEADSSNFPELLMEVRSLGSGENDYEWPALPLEEARAALLDLVGAGYVEVFAEKDKALSNSDATEAINDDAAWANLMPDTPGYYEIYYTDEGAQALKRARPRFQHVGRVTHKKQRRA